jgi:hypothetical protein
MICRMKQKNKRREKKKTGPVSLPCGVYRHYKGPYYLVLGVARHSETEEAFVVYVRLYSKGGCPLWIRPLEHFMGMVANSKGRRCKRFTYVGLEQPTGSN